MIDCPRCLRGKLLHDECVNCSYSINLVPPEPFKREPTPRRNVLDSDQRRKQSAAEYQQRKRATAAAIKSLARQP